MKYEHPLGRQSSTCLWWPVTDRTREQKSNFKNKINNILDYDLVFIPVLLPCHWALGTEMPCLQRHMNKQLLQKCFYFNKMPHNLICFLFSSCNFYSKISYNISIC
ncbi:uncharacterized protein LOC141859343 isoform X1 [Acropora palmata]|uniref:uncharacterized protein LOC141859343 isoform X1 n=1 Tax=Acropora palmata TaxID=6131 RepID=UPI003DA1515A